MATLEQSRTALKELAGRLGTSPQQRAAAGLDRSLSCTLPDLGVTFSGQLRNGRIEQITTGAAPKAQIRLRMSSDDLLALTAGSLSFPAAWASGRVRIEAGVLDLLKLRSLI